MRETSSIATILSQAPDIPVIMIEDVAHAVPLARALVAGGVNVLEITLRTEAALDAIRRIRDEVPDAVVGAGTVLTPTQLEHVAATGAAFAVSPGAPRPCSMRPRLYRCRCCQERPQPVRSWPSLSAVTPT